MCKAAVAADGVRLGEGINASVLFMIGMVFATPLALCFVVWRSYKSGQARAARGEHFQPEGKLRWSDREVPHEPRSG